MNFKHGQGWTHVTLRYAMGKWLKLARRRKKTDARELGSMIGYSRSTIYEWEAGAVQLTTDNFIAVCLALGLDPKKEIGTVFREAGL